MSLFIKEAKAPLNLDQPNAAESMPYNQGGANEQSCLQHDSVNYSVKEPDEMAHTRSPDLLIVNFLQLLLKIFAVCLATVKFKRASSFGTVFDGFIQLFEDGAIGSLEDRSPIKSSTTSGGRAGRVHVVLKPRLWANGSHGFE